jgi:hypothetical protein
MRRRDEGAKRRKARKRLSRDTRANYLMHFRIARDWAGDSRPAPSRPADVETFYDALVEERGHVMANRWAAAALHGLSAWRRQAAMADPQPVQGLEKMRRMAAW